MTTREKLQIKQFYEDYSFEKAAAYLFSLMKKTEEEDAILLYNLAFSLYCSSDYSRSLKIMNLILKKTGNDYQIMLLAARIYMKCHYYNRAERLLTHIISCSSINSEASALLSVYYYLVGDDIKFQIQYEKAKETDPESPGFIVADARLRLYRKRKKAGGDALDMALTHITGERHLAAIETLYCISRKKKREAKTILKGLITELPEEVSNAFSMIC